jgi:transposase
MTTEATPEESAAPEGKRLRAERIKHVSKVHMSARDIATARGWREKEGMTIEAIAAHFKKSPSTIQKLFRRLGVKKGARAAELADKIEKKMDEEVLTDAIIRTRRIKETREDTYRMAVMITKLSMSEIVEAKKRGESVAVQMSSQRVYNTAMATLRAGQEIRNLSLGIKDGEDPADENLPDLLLTELTPEEILAIQSSAAQKDMVDDILSKDSEATGATVVIDDTNDVVEIDDGDDNL